MVNFTFEDAMRIAYGKETANKLLGTHGDQQQFIIRIKRTDHYLFVNTQWHCSLVALVEFATCLTLDGAERELHFWLMQGEQAEIVPKDQALQHSITNH